MYRLGFAVKVLGEGGIASADTRRWQSGPHLRRSLELLFLNPRVTATHALDIGLITATSSGASSCRKCQALRGWPRTSVAQRRHSVRTVRRRRSCA